MVSCHTRCETDDSQNGAPQVRIRSRRACPQRHEAGQYEFSSRLLASRLSPGVMHCGLWPARQPAQWLLELGSEEKRLPESSSVPQK